MKIWRELLGYVKLIVIVGIFTPYYRVGIRCMA